MVQLLLDAGADVNAQSRRYGNALQAASARGHYQVIKLLLEKGADVNAQSAIWGNALQAALGSDHKETALMLLKNGVNLESANLDEDKLRKLQGVLEEGTNLEQADLSKDLEKVQELLKRANVDAQDGYSTSSTESSSTSS